MQTDHAWSDGNTDASYLAETQKLKTTDAGVVAHLDSGITAVHLVPVVQRVDNAVHGINRYPVNKYYQNKPRYPLDSDLSSG